MSPIPSVLLLLLALAAGAPQARGQGTDGSPVGDVLARLPDGRVTRWQGRFGEPGQAPEQILAAFLDELAPRFGDGVLGGARTLPGREGSLHLPQVVQGAPILGHGLWLRRDDHGRILAAHGVLDPTAASLEPALISPALAEVLAREVLGRPAGPARLGQVVLPTSEGLALVHEVELVSERLPYRVRVDAHTGRVLSLVEWTSHGGALSWDDQLHPFATGPGRGRAFPSLGAALKQSARRTRLVELAHEHALWGVAEAGTLLGAAGRVLDASGTAPVSADLLFDFDPLAPTLVPTLGPAFQLFDQVNTAHWLGRGGRFWEGLQGEGALGPVAPVYVNYDKAGTGYANAFFSPADPDGPGGLPPGYLLFGELTAVTGDPRHDLSRDPSVVLHEQTHLVLDRQGLAFGDAGLDEPPRALNEALADYVAATQLSRPRLGEVLAAHAGSVLGVDGASLRQLDGDLTLPDDLPAMLATDTGLPEEHAAGELFASWLWDLRGALGPRLADALVLEGLDAWPQHTAELGFPLVTPANAAAAYRATFAACVAALAEDLPGHGSQASRRAGRLWGAAASRGLVGTSSDDPAPLVLDDGGRLLVEGRFRGSLDEHVYALDLDAGQLLTFAVRGRQGATVDLELPGLAEQGGDPSVPAGLLALVPKTSNGAGTSARYRKVSVQLDGQHRLRVRDTGAPGGAYRLLIRLR